MKSQPKLTDGRRLAGKKSNACCEMWAELLHWHMDDIKTNVHLYILQPLLSPT
jgi:hypothetical protein